MTTEDKQWINDVLHFWFEELAPKDWFASSETLDNTIKDRFSAIHNQVSAQTELPADATPTMALAAIIVLDQFSRNVYRGTKQAFAFDSISLSLTKQAMAREFYVSLSDEEKLFFYMPIMHSENLDDQKLAVTLFTELGKQEHAEEHLAIIEKFGRFPHRNDVLGRESTPAEIIYLKDAKRFGQ